MEPDAEKIPDIAQKHGLTEDEARVLYHLDRVHELYDELPGKTNLLNTINFGFAYQVMVSLLMERVLHRDRPEGWSRSYLSEREDDD